MKVTQQAVVSGSAVVVATPVACYTDANGAVVGEPNPLVTPTASSVQQAINALP